MTKCGLQTFKVATSIRNMTTWQLRYANANPYRHRMTEHLLIPCSEAKLFNDMWSLHATEEAVDKSTSCREPSFCLTHNVRFAMRVCSVGL